MQHVMYRPLDAHEEVTVYYNNPNERYIAIDDEVGGCFPVDKCVCGAKYCMGELVRKLYWGQLHENDAQFFWKDPNGRLMLDLTRLRWENEFVRMGWEKAQQSRAKVTEILSKDQDSPLTLNEVYSTFNAMTPRDAYPSTYMWTSCVHKK